MSFPEKTSYQSPLAGNVTSVPGLQVAIPNVMFIKSRHISKKASVNDLLPWNLKLIDKVSQKSFQTLVGLKMNQQHSQYLLAVTKQKTETGTQYEFVDGCSLLAPEIKRLVEGHSPQNSPNKINKVFWFTLNRLLNGISLQYVGKVDTSEGTFDLDQDTGKLIAACYSDKNREALFEIAESFDKGRILDKNPIAAFKCYLQAANLEHPQACYIVSKAYEFGYMVEKSSEHASRYLQEAVKGKQPQALYEIGKQLEDNGHFQKAAAMYQQAADQNHSEAAYRLYNLYANSQFGMLNQEQAITYCEKAAKLNHPNGLAKFGYYHTQGLVKPSSSWATAVPFFQKSAAQLDPEGLLYFGECHLQKTSLLPYSPKAVINNFLLAANIGSAEAAFRLGTIYENGQKGIQQNNKLAGIYYEKAAASKNAKYEYELGRFYLKQNEQDKGRYYLGLAAQKNYAAAFYALGQDEVNPVEKLKYFRAGVRLFHPQSVTEVRALSAKGHYSAEEQGEIAVEIAKYYMHIKNPIETVKMCEVGSKLRNAEANCLLARTYSQMKIPDWKDKCINLLSRPENLAHTLSKVLLGAILVFNNQPGSTQFQKGEAILRELCGTTEELQAFEALSHAYTRIKQYAAAEPYLRKGAVLGSAWCCQQLAYLMICNIYSGKFDEKLKLLQTAFDKGLKETGNVLAALYFNGEGGFGIDYDKAKNLLESGNFTLNADSKYLLGKIYVYGLGSTKTSPEKDFKGLALLVEASSAGVKLAKEVLNEVGTLGFPENN